MVFICIPKWSVMLITKQYISSYFACLEKLLFFSLLINSESFLYHLMKFEFKYFLIIFFLILLLLFIHLSSHSPSLPPISGRFLDLTSDSICLSSDITPGEFGGILWVPKLNLGWLHEKMLLEFTKWIVV